MGYRLVELERYTQVSARLPSLAHGSEGSGEVAVGPGIAGRNVEGEGERHRRVPIPSLTEQSDTEIIVCLGVAWIGLDRGGEVRHGLLEPFRRLSSGIRFGPLLPETFESDIALLGSVLEEYRADVTGAR